MRKMRRKGEMDGKELMFLVFVLILLVGTAIAVPVGIHLSNNNKKSVPTNTPEPGGTGQPVPPIVTPQSGQPPPVPPIAPPQPGQPPPVQPIVPPPPVTPQSGQAPPVPPPIVPLPIAPQSGQALPVPPLAPPSVPKKYTYVRGAKNESQTWGCKLPDSEYTSVHYRDRDELENECSLRTDCKGYYDNGRNWLISTDTEPDKCLSTPAPSQKYPFFYPRKEVEG